jgi:prevent-host-death family protein
MHLKFTEDILPVTDFRNNAADILNQLAQTCRPILLTQRGRASAVLLDVREYQKLCDRLEELERLLGGEAGLPATPRNAQAAPAIPEGTAADDDLVRELERWIEQET